MRKAIKIFLLTVLLFVIVCAVLVVDLSPSVNADAPQQVNNADTVQPLLAALKKSLRSRYEAQQLYVSEAQASSLAGFVHRALEQANAQVTFVDKAVSVAITYRMNTGLFPVFLNLKVVMLDGNGFQVDSVKIGSIKLPGDFALALAEYLANTYTSSIVASKAIESVKSLAISKTGVEIELEPLDNLLREFKNIKTGGNRQEAKILNIRIAHYLRLLDGMYVATGSSRTVAPSLSYYLHGAMQEAAELSQHGSATLENEAAILAVAIFAGNRRFTSLTGDLSFAFDRIPQAYPKPVLLNRQDLSLHFVFSAALKLLSEKGISIALGEFKELMDRGRGGSGYSFVDLAADMSGVHFAELAVDPERAQKVQQIMAVEANEKHFMVSVEGLVEGLSKAEFTKQFTAVDSEAYNKVVSEINSRIKELPISQ